MRISKDKATEIDLSIPINTKDFNITEDSCFGNEWDMKDRTCQFCSDNVVCGVLYSHKLKDKIIKTENESVKFLDMADFSNIDENDLLNEINGIKSIDFINLIKEKANIDDNSTVVAWIKTFVKNSNGKVKIKDGIVNVLS